MFQKQTLFFLTFFLFLGQSPAQPAPKIHFADRLLLGLHYGLERDWEGDDHNNRFDMAHFWGPRAGLSINGCLYAGIQARLISARNFETPCQSFYMAGLWARGYLMRPTEPDRPNRWNFFLETGCMTGNFAFENKNLIEYYVRTSGRWYIPVILGSEFRLYKQLTMEGCLQGYYNSGKNWDQYGIAYLSIGLNYHLGKGPE